LETLFVQPGFFMTVLYLEAPAAIAVSLSVLMAGARVMRQRAGNSGWVDTIWTFSLGFAGTGTGSVLRSVVGAVPNARQWLVAALASTIPTRRAALAQSGGRFSE
jgi:steroid 5-alpha reductase family enzyme